MHHHFFRERKSVVINFLTIPYYICYDLVTFNPLIVVWSKRRSLPLVTTLLLKTSPAVANTKKGDDLNERHYS